jgi:hypothetical protein
MLLISIGHLRDFFGKRFYPSYYKDLMPHNVSCLLCAFESLTTALFEFSMSG